MNNAKISSKKVKNKNEKIITLEGDLGLANSSELKAELLKLITELDALEINSKELTNVDISTIQVLKALKIEAETLNKELRININVPENIESLLLHAGILINEL